MARIVKFHIENFKALANFDLPPEGFELGQFTCLVGLNGSGKSTVLQALEFVAAVVKGTETSYLQWNLWKSEELKSKLYTPYRDEIKISIELDIDENSNYTWRATYSLPEGRCIEESITESTGDERLLYLHNQTLSARLRSGEISQDSIRYKYYGSIISALSLRHFDSRIEDFASTISEVTSSYSAVEQRAKHLLHGSRLATFPKHRLPKLSRSVSKFYPQIQEISLLDQEDYKSLLSVREILNGQTHQIDEKHINDGLLRLISILAYDDEQPTILLLDEIENGINPEIVKQLMEFLLGLDKQVIVTTHSPIILNYIPDDIARESVIFLYRTKEGMSKCKRFFDIPEAEERLGVLGPGEVFVDLNLTELSERLANEGA